MLHLIFQDGLKPKDTKIVQDSLIELKYGHFRDAKKFSQEIDKTPNKIFDHHNQIQQFLLKGLLFFLSLFFSFFFFFFFFFLFSLTTQSNSPANPTVQTANPTVRKLTNQSLLDSLIKVQWHTTKILFFFIFSFFSFFPFDFFFIL